jgi:hypothetical protein
MADIRIHRYAVDPNDDEEFLRRRETLIATIRVHHPGLVETRLIRLEDETYVDTWRWESAGQMQAAGVAAPGIPEVAAAMSLVRDRTSNDGRSWTSGDDQES